MMRFLLALMLLLVLAPPARAGELIDRAATELQSENVYVDPDADPTITDAQAEALQDRIVAEGAGPMYIAVMPRDIAGEAAGSPLEALGEAQRNGGSPPGEGVGGTGGLVLLGLLGAGGAAIAVSRRNRRRRDDAEFQQAKANARDDLVALGDDIRALDLDASMPGVDAQARADYDHAVARYTEAEEQWERARRPQELAPVGEALEEGRWAMASAKARFNGDTPPQRRPPCFFDPRHGPSTRDVEWSPPYGEPRLVPACEADALRIEEGVDPQMREVDWHGQRVPYWQGGPGDAPFAGGVFWGVRGRRLRRRRLGRRLRRRR